MLADWSQCKLSAKTGIDRSRLSSIECGYVIPRIKEQDIIEKVLLAEIARRAAEFREVVSGASS
jgi:transcriptional regulator with XRE-family HTH domain